MSSPRVITQCPPLCGVQKISGLPGELAPQVERRIHVALRVESRRAIEIEIDDEVRGDVRGSRDELCCHARVNNAAHEHLLD